MFEFSEKFNFIQGKHLTLKLLETSNGNNELLPSYHFEILLNSEDNASIGDLIIRIGENLRSTYEGNLEVYIKEEYRGHHYSYYASRMLFSLLRYHKMDKMYICCDEGNMAFRKIIDMLGGQLLQIDEKPSDFEVNDPLIENYAIYIVEIPPVDFENSLRHEHSSMALVFSGDKVLTLTDVDGYVVLPKGHIEEGENSLQAAMRECYEESGCMLIKEDYIKQVRGIEYSFSYRNYKKLTPLQFYSKFGVCMIHKIVDVHVFKVDEDLPIKITEKDHFIEGSWMKIDEFLFKNTYDDQLQVINDGLEAISEK